MTWRSIDNYIIKNQTINILNDQNKLLNLIKLVDCFWSENYCPRSDNVSLHTILIKIKSSVTTKACRPKQSIRYDAKIII